LELEEVQEYWFCCSWKRAVEPNILWNEINQEPRFKIEVQGEEVQREKMN
jgi:hypothetical protein